jgi:hypothetical protein
MEGASVQPVNEGELRRSPRSLVSRGRHPDTLGEKQILISIPTLCIIDRAPLLVPRPMAQAVFEPGIRTLKIQIDLN